jgi:hypothetical protein
MHVYKKTLAARAAGAIAASAVAALSIVTPTAADQWVLLGSRSVTDRVDHDTIAVTATRGDFDRVKLTVKFSTVRFIRVLVRYGNGTTQELEMRDVVPAGGETRAIDLRGADRVIKAVDFWYEAKSVGHRGALVRLYGRH